MRVTAPVTATRASVPRSDAWGGDGRENFVVDLPRNVQGATAGFGPACQNDAGRDAP